jgi:hypothetical protein
VLGLSALFPSCRFSHIVAVMKYGDAGNARNAARVGWSTHLDFWDVVFAMLGFAVAGILRAVVVHGYNLFWWGAPLAFAVARRTWLPQLSRRPDTPRAPLSFGRRIAAYSAASSR